MQGLVNLNQSLANQIGAKSDAEAIQAWLFEYRDKATTFRSYQKEAERFLLWCTIERNKTLNELTRDDFDVYFTFLKNPSPKEIWCAPRGSKARKRGEPGWKPFVGPLSPPAIATAITILHSMMSYLAQARYLAFNPLTLMRKKTNAAGSIAERQIKTLERILEDDEWHAILETLADCQDERLRFLVAVLFLLGLRISEVEGHNWSAFRKVQGKWWFFVRGKGNKVGKIPVNDELLAAVSRFRTYLRLPALPEPEESGPLIPSWRGPDGLSTRQMSGLLKGLALKTAEKFSDSPDKANKLRQFSPHWLRHLSASMQDRAGISFKHIKANHRHESDDTTRLYVHAWDDERHEEMQKLSFKISNRPNSY